LSVSFNVACATTKLPMFKMRANWQEVTTTDSKGNRNRHGAVVILLFCLLAVGCSRGPKVVRVRGTVTYKGQPLVNGFVMFNPADPQKGHVARGKIAEDGSFTMSTFEPGDGVMPAEYIITVRSWVPGSGPTPMDEAAGVFVTSSIPERYMDPRTSGLKETVGSSAMELNLELAD